jgi:HlyD family secretion protein
LADSTSNPSKISPRFKNIPWLGKAKHPLPWLIGIVAVATVAVGTATYAVVQIQGRETDLSELTVPVTAENLSITIEASGTVVPDKSVNLSPKTSGRIKELYVEQGDFVQQGQRLALMENDDIQAQSVQAQANLNQARARLAEARAGNRIEQIQQAQAQVVQARARLEQAEESTTSQVEQLESQVTAANSRFELAQNRVDRYQYLLEQGAVALDRYDEALNEFRSAQASLDEAQQRLEQAKNTNRPEVLQQAAAVAEAEKRLEELQRGSRPEVIAQLQAEVDAAQAQVLGTQVQLQDTIITAPFAGIVTQRYATEGAFVTPTTSASSTASATSTSILALASGLKIIANVPEVDIVYIEPGQPVDIYADAYPDQVFEGIVERVAPEAVVEQNVTSFEVEVMLVTGEDQLRSGMNTDVVFLGQDLADSLVVPTVAIVTEDGETGVMVASEDGEAEFRPVTIGVTIENQTQIIEGVEPGELVYIDLPEELRPDEE